MKLGRTYASVLLLLLAASSAIAGEAGGIAWHRDVRSAWLAAQKNNHPLLVFVTSENCLYCTQMKTRTYADRSVIGAVNQSFEAVALDANVESPLLKELRSHRLSDDVHHLDQGRHPRPHGGLRRTGGHGQPLECPATNGAGGKNRQGSLILALRDDSRTRRLLISARGADSSRSRPARRNCFTSQSRAGQTRRRPTTIGTGAEKFFGQRGATYVAPSPSDAWFYVRRVVGRHRDHRANGRPLAPRRAGGARKCPPLAVLEQSQADGAGDSIVCRRNSSAAAGQH